MEFYHYFFQFNGSRRQAARSASKARGEERKNNMPLFFRAPPLPSPPLAWCLSSPVQSRKITPVLLAAQKCLNHQNKTLFLLIMPMQTRSHLKSRPLNKLRKRKVLVLKPLKGILNLRANQFEASTFTLQQPTGI